MMMTGFCVKKKGRALMQEEETCRVVSRIMLVIHHRNLP